jgi:hypothetical protein
MNDAELRRKAALAIRMALTDDTDAGFEALREYVSELDEDGQNRLYKASERVGDAVLDVQARERS